VQKRHIDLAFIGHKIEHEELRGDFVTTDKLVLIGSDVLRPLHSLDEIEKVPLIIREKEKDRLKNRSFRFFTTIVFR
jgi:hypothetical protein